jgi:acetyl esterase/lipase
MSYAPLPPFWAGATPAARDAAYNNVGAVPDSAALIAARVEASAAVRAAHPAHLDLPYGAAERQRWDLYPAASAEAPCLIFIHGGYWQRNRREDFASLIEGALSLGWSAALPGYTLAPEASMTGIVGEIEAALDWLAEHGPRHGIAGRKVLSGWSAGGHLAAMALGHPSVTAGFAISGIFELAPIRDTDLNEKLALTAAEIETLSPMRRPMLPKPLAIAYGTAELPELRRQSRDYHAARALAHAPGPLIPVCGADHFRIVDALRAPRGELMRAMADLLEG